MWRGQGEAARKGAFIPVVTSCENENISNFIDTDTCERNECCTEEQWSVSLLCTPGQALGTAAVLSFTGCIGMAFGYQLFLQKRKKG